MRKQNTEWHSCHWKQNASLAVLRKRKRLWNVVNQLYPPASKLSIVANFQVFSQMRNGHWWKTLRHNQTLSGPTRKWKSNYCPNHFVGVCCWSWSMQVSLSNLHFCAFNPTVCIFWIRGWRWRNLIPRYLFWNEQASENQCCCITFSVRPTVQHCTQHNTSSTLDSDQKQQNHLQKSHLVFLMFHEILVVLLFCLLNLVLVANNPLHFLQMEKRSTGDESYCWEGN